MTIAPIEPVNPSTVEFPSPLPVGWKWLIKLIEDAGHKAIICATCGYPGSERSVDDRGMLVAHPGRDWPRRVPAGAS